MSSNPGVRTIEEELVNALYKAEAITEDGKACLGKVSDLMLVVNQAHYTRLSSLNIPYPSNFSRNSPVSIIIIIVYLFHDVVT